MLPFSKKRRAKDDKGDDKLEDAAELTTLLDSIHQLLVKSELVEDDDKQGGGAARGKRVSADGPTPCSSKLLPSTGADPFPAISGVPVAPDAPEKAGGKLVLSKAEVAARPSALTKLVADVEAGSDNAQEALQELAAKNEEGALAALVALLRDGSAGGRAKAATTLSNLALNPDSNVAIAKEPGALAGLVALVQDGSASGRVDAAVALSNLAVNEANKVKVARTPGALGALVSVVCDERVMGKAIAGAAKKALSERPETKAKLLQLGCDLSFLA